MSNKNYQVTITVTGQDRASGPLGGVQNALGGIGKIAGGILTAGVLTAIGRQIVDIGRQALDSYANYERLGMALQSLVAREMVNSGAAKDLASAMDISSEKAKELQGWITKLAIQSPFQQEDIANSFRLAMAYGFTTDEAKRMTTAMVDFAAGSGASSDSMNRIALALGQMKAKGKVAGQELLQLTEAGLPVRDILAKAFGVTTERLVEMQEKGLLPADKAIEAITASLEKDFGGAAKRQAGTFSGLISSLEDIKTVGLRTFFEGTFKAIQPYVSKFVDTLSSPEFMARLSQLGQNLGDFINKAVGGFQLMRARMELFMQSPIFQTISEAFQKIFKVLTQPKVLNGASRIFEGIKGFLQDLGAKVIPFALSMIEKIGNWFEENGPLIALYVQTIADRFNNYFLPALLLVWDVAAPLLEGLLDLILGIVKFTMKVFTGDWKGAWNTFVKILQNAGKAVWKALTNLFGGIAKMMGTSGDEIKKIWSDNWNQLKQILKKVWDLMVSAVKESAADLGAKIGKAINEIRADWQNGWNLIRSVLSNVWNAMVSLVAAQIAAVLSSVTNTLANIRLTWENGWNAIKNFVASVWSAIVSTVSSWAGKIAGYVSSAITSVRTIWESGWNTVKNFVASAWSTIVGTIVSRANEIVTKVTSLVTEIKNGFSISNFISIGQNIVNGIKSGVTSMWNSFVAWFQSKIQGMIDTALSVLGINSPSRVFANIGIGIMEGLAKGITKSMNLPQLALDNVLGSFSGGGLIGAGNSYSTNQTDQSQKYYAPVTVVVPAGGDVNAILRQLQTR